MYPIETTLYLVHSNHFSCSQGRQSLSHAHGFRSINDRKWYFGTTTHFPRKGQKNMWPNKMFNVEIVSQWGRYSRMKVILDDTYRWWHALRGYYASFLWNIDNLIVPTHTTMVFAYQGLATSNEPKLPNKCFSFKEHLVKEALHTLLVFSI